MGFPPPPVDTIDWNNMGFQFREVNGHIESHYSISTGQWSPPTYHTDPYLRLHGMAPALNYGQQSYEGIKAFRTPSNQIAIFRPSMNAARMAHSASYIAIPAVPEEHFLECVHLAVSINAAYVPPHETGAAMYIRPILFGSSAQLGLDPPEEYTFCVYVLPVGVYHGVHPIDCLILEDFDRAAPFGTGSAKIGGNYAPVMPWSEKAKKEGFGITLHLDSKTRSEVDEFSTSGFIGLKKSPEGQVTLVVPNSKSVIKSITSDSICEIGRSFGWAVERRTVKYEELPQFDEVMAAGTAAALVPIKSITMRSRGDAFKYQGGRDEPGEGYVRLLTTLKGIQQGKIKDTFGWLEYVKEVPKGFGQGANGVVDDEVNGVNGTIGANIDRLP